MSVTAKSWSAVASAFTGNSLSITAPAAKEKKAAAEQLRLQQLKLYTSLTLKEYETLKGRKLNFLERQFFKINQHRMKKVLKAYANGEGPTVLEKISWLCKGILLGPVAVLIAYIFLKDDDRELIKWAWFGCIGFAALLILLLSMA